MLIYTQTLGYFAIPCIILFMLSCLSAVWSALTENEKTFNISGILAVLCFSGIITSIMIPTYNDEDIKAGEALAACKIVEENAYNGLFSDNVNKIDCDGIIKNIPVNTYNKLMYVYNKNKFRAQE
ncbi:Uncharacterised protein [Shigella sonnei]|uniref:hypothetical protein n=1 Tax=Enterobacteriaceae TaxID=543 RepID=UPI0006636232|nr:MULTISPECIES: hypothetical protein [Enterobacteriaceae]MED7308705.1 hypothetical protein [Escherichia coli O157]MDO2681503.1 hypothetical protein [Escherichia coli]MDO7773549.1 hypothetical protein [Escherichia coli]CSF10343.1 Uncharacterised protein [Shigella sonnei]CSF14989.1 Uncharacterised protein [Shigella sonnei]